jgi:hypothetical protein
MKKKFFCLKDVEEIFKMVQMDKKFTDHLIYYFENYKEVWTQFINPFKSYCTFNFH